MAAQAGATDPEFAASDATAGASSAPDTAGIASAFAAAIPTPKADDTQVFHGLFADDYRAVPLAPMVSALWGVPQAVTPSGAPAQKSQTNGMLDLFKDPPASSS